MRAGCPGAGGGGVEGGHSQAPLIILVLLDGLEHQFLYSTRLLVGRDELELLLLGTLHWKKELKKKVGLFCASNTTTAPQNATVTSRCVAATIPTFLERPKVVCVLRRSPELHEQQHHHEQGDGVEANWSALAMLTAPI